MGQKFEVMNKKFLHARVALGKALELRLSFTYQILLVGLLIDKALYQKLVVVTWCPWPWLEEW